MSAVVVHEDLPRSSTNRAHGDAMRRFCSAPASSCSSTRKGIDEETTMTIPHKSRNPLTRREALRKVGNGFGMMALAGMIGDAMKGADIVAPNGAVGAAMLDHPAKVKRVIFLFMNGG